ncbi:MAG: DUF1501 domain-containing protein [Pirellulaceae bacterium]|nr:DUF1501 domain-containing protein [Pirellulaceae bacterium]
MTKSVGRRLFLQGTLAGSMATCGLSASRGAEVPASASEPRRQVLFLWLAGGASQFEMWDPKPHRPTGGPFRSIPTNVPGVHFCELMPRLAQRMHRLTVIRSLSTGISEHEQAADLMSTGRPKEPALVYPEIGVVLAKELATGRSPLPDYVSVFRTSEGRRKAGVGFLGAAHTPVHLERSSRPENIERPAGMSEDRFAERESLRAQLSRGFLAGRAGRDGAEQYEAVHGRVAGLMDSAGLFDIEHEPERDRERYGRTPFGRHCLLARRLLAAGVPVVKVARGFWDSHHDNFESHRELVTDFDRVFSVLLDDLAERGMLERTLVLVLSEFGRTPKINKDVGRDHYAAAWSCALAGAGTRPGALHGVTDANGIEVADGKVSAGDLTATIYRAAGLDLGQHYQVGLRPVPITIEGSKPVAEVLT